ncbi:hypothetical protein GLOIN_2v1655702 [Rhizophagus irregularis DAOM 181602=DAOM 197198]|nr:hypothetical protein GLOIN_2v1655702 [Rhizophagus irregularis DAOM 181602=DAOM 197198]
MKKLKLPLNYPFHLSQLLKPLKNRVNLVAVQLCNKIKFFTFTNFIVRSDWKLNIYVLLNNHLSIICLLNSIYL